MSRTTKFGLRLPPLPLDRGPELLTAFAERSERRGLSSFWIPDRLIPVGGYLRFAETEPLLEPMTALALAAGRTTNISLGTGVIIAPLRHPLVLAKQAATLHHLSGGRLILGLGTGWAPEEFDALQVPREERGRRTDEAIEILRTAFLGQPFDHDGPFFAFRGAQIDPASARGPALWGSGGGGAPEFRSATASGSAPAVIRRLAQLDGWLTRPAATPDQIAAEFSDVAEHARRIGRDPDEIELGHVNFAHLVDGPRDEVLAEQQRVFAEVIGQQMPFERQREVHWTGTLGDVSERIERLIASGVQHIVFHPLRADLEQLDLWVDGVLRPLGVEMS